MAGTVGISLHDRVKALGWLSSDPKGSDNAYDVTLAGTKVFEALGIDLEAIRARAAVSPAHAWIGVSGGLMLAEPWEQRC